MFRLLFARRADWAALAIACLLSLTLILLGRGDQARVAWFLQHTLLAPVDAEPDVFHGRPTEKWSETRHMSIRWRNDLVIAEDEISAPLA